MKLNRDTWNARNSTRELNHASGIARCNSSLQSMLACEREMRACTRFRAPLYARHLLVLLPPAPELSRSSSHARALALLFLCRFAATKMNRHSSRSHSVCRLLVEISHGATQSSTPTTPSNAAHDALAGATDHTPGKRGDAKRGVSFGTDTKQDDGSTHDLHTWRRKSIAAISDKIGSHHASAKKTKATLTLCGTQRPIAIHHVE